MIRITRETEYAFMLLSILLEGPDTTLSATALAEKTGITIPVTSKVLKRLVKEGVLSSLRGAYGGYRLAINPQSVSALDVVHAMEGKPELVECANGEVDCVLAPHCRISPFWHQLNHDITQMLAGRTLAEMKNMENKNVGLS
ncbi:SUF system Fe-S cluster assembly regulator [Suttonella sp. R2A3]|uniref:SUF system Fe-S cluster assembly regulator n=1 Tax=Suttonella sp. R2A3 TaxID=2908648 RepID=UPI001F47A13E|nr:SUF system Fe-S cluster assembly regulator [Suttonella sp. R2A3]UJF24713.1 SUF system Fe-S cluster assembly regulator [Suttonella sp. R2A3]